MFTPVTLVEKHLNNSETGTPLLSEKPQVEGQSCPQLPHFYDIYQKSNVKMKFTSLAFLWILSFFSYKETEASYG